MDAEQERRSSIKVERGDGLNDAIQLRIANVRGDVGETTLSMIIQQDGDVSLSLTDPDKEMVDIEFCTRAGGGKNPLLADAFRGLIRNLADQIEDAQNSQQA